MEMIRLSEIKTRAPKDLQKEQVKAETETIVQELDELQNLLYAEGKNSLLVILQGMDASGKDGVIRNVFGHMNPMGVRVKSYKAPTAEELSHDFLWRIHNHSPQKGMIQIFNRSHYEDILTTRVHEWCDDETAAKRMKAINDWEDLLCEHNNTRILKFYLHVSPEEQQERLAERLEDPTKMWKFNAKDHDEAKLWNQYMSVYEDAFQHCNKHPWTIVPSDQNWFKEFTIAKQVRDTLKEMDMKYPALKTEKPAN